MSIQQIQIALIAAGFPVGPTGADGIWGRNSIAGLKAFQRSRVLPDTGVADAATLKALFPTAAPAMILPAWLEEATRLLGTAEIVGAKHNATIMGWAKEQWAKLRGVSYRDDETPWCGLFVGHCIGVTLPQEPLPGNPLGAREWLKLGSSIQTPSVGAVAVFNRPGSSWSGHVAFYVGERASDGAIRVRGGNQSNKVSDIWMARSRLLGYRWPRTGPAPSGGRKFLTDNGSLSANEA